MKNIVFSLVLATFLVAGLAGWLCWLAGFLAGWLAGLAESGDRKSKMLIFHWFYKLFCWLGWRWAGWLAGLAGWLARWLAGWPGTRRIQEAPNVDIFKVLAIFLKIE